MWSRDSSTDLSIIKNFELVCLHMWERSWLDKVPTVELNTRTLDRSTNPKERMKMSMQFNSAVRMIDPIRNTSKSPTMSENPSTVGLPTRHHQHHANRLHETKLGCDETKQSAEKKKRLICHKCGGKGHPARLCPSADDCQDVDEVGTEPSSLEWCDDPIATINSVSERNYRTRGGKELLAFVDSGAVDTVLPSQYVPSIRWRRLPSHRVEVVLRGKRVTHQALRQGRFRVETSAGSNIEHHLGSRVCAQAADLCQSSA